MTTVAQLIKHLQTLPQEAVVKVRDEYGNRTDFSIDEHVFAWDLRGNPFIKEHSTNFNKVWVEIGE